MNFASAIAYWAADRGPADAIVFGSQRISWQGLEAESARVAAGLRGAGIEPGDRVGILAQNHPRWCVLSIGILRAGAIVVPLNVRMVSSELAYAVDHSGCAMVAVDAGLSPILEPDARERPTLGTLALTDDAFGERSWASLDGEWGENESTTAETPAVIAFTSGTTGRPKGAVLTHGNLFAHAHQKIVTDGWADGVRTLLPVPLAFTGGIICNFFTTFAAGGTLFLEPDFSPRRALDLLVRERITAMMGVPVMWQGIAEEPEFAEADLRSLTTAITGGATVPEPLLRRWAEKGVALRQAYSQTEASGLAVQLPPDLAHRTDSAGRPVLHTELRIVDDEAREVATHEVGEILLRGPQIMAGYWNDPDATAATLVGGWLHTGDMGRVDDQGLLSVVDRKKDVVISGGLNVYPAEVELVVAEYPGVVESAAFGVASARWGESVALVIRGEALDTEAILAHCRKHLADYKVPRHVEVLEDPLPRSMSGKVLRRELKETYAHLGD